MKLFDVRTRKDKRVRFRRPEFQDQLRQARSFERRTPPRPTGFWGVFWKALGLSTPWRRFIFGFLFLVIAYFLFVSSVFLVGRVELVAGVFSAEEVSALVAGMRSRRMFLIPRNHLLIIDRETVLRAIQDELPQVRAVTLFERTGRNRIRLGLEERKPSFVWQAAGGHFLLDQDGVVFQRVLNYDPAVYPEQLLVDRLDAPVSVGQKVNADKILAFVQTLVSLWPEIVTQTGYQSFSFPGVSSLDIFVKTGIGFQVYFDVERPVETQLRSLILLLSREIKPETYSGLSYIDLRLPSVAYYCYLDAPCAPENANQATLE